MEELKTLKDLAFFNKNFVNSNIVIEDDLKQSAIAHIKHMRREGRDGYYANLDEKSAIPKLMEIFNLNEEDVK